jgi:ABC-type antimicrobial peptide transport system permease subunit
MKKEKPPRLFHAFFRWYCSPEVRQHIEGDLLEFYNERLNTLGRNKANLKFARDVLRLFRPSIIRRPNVNQLIPIPGMYRNHLKTSWRNFRSNKAFSAINVAGLTLGLTCSMLIGLWVNDEQQMDKFHEDIDRLYVITTLYYSGSQITGGYDTPGLLGDELPKVFPEIAYASNFGWRTEHTLTVGDKMMRVSGNFAGKDFFRIFSYHLLLGSRDKVLSTPESIVLSRKTAINYFGSPEEAMDKTIRFEAYRDLKVTGVFEDIGDNSSDQFDYLLSWDFMVERNPWMKDWYNSGPYTYLKLTAGADAAAVNTKIREFLKDYDRNYSEIERLELGLQPYGDKYLHSNFKNGKVSGGRIEYVNIFKGVAIFLVLIACVNFMNLSTARSLKRAKEIGVRKTIGALRSTLMGQFMMEALLFTLIAVTLALALVTVVLGPFNLLTEKHIVLPYSSLDFWKWTFIVTVATAFLAGAYPAVVLSSFRPAAVLKKVVTLRSSSVWVRKGLVVFQFAMSMIFIVGMLTVSRQVTYIQTKNVGYNKDNLLYVPISGTMADHFDTYKEELLQQPGVKAVARMSHRPVNIGNSTPGVDWEGKDPEELPTFSHADIGHDFVRTTGMELLLGRDFSRQFNDSSNYIINESAWKVIGYDNPIGMPLTFWEVKGTIVGVIKDFHFQSLHEPISPLVLRLGKGRMWGWTLIRIDPAQTKESLAGMASLQARYSPEMPFTYQFADEQYGSYYRSERLVEQLSRYFAGLAIFISCLGLLGSVMFAAERRAKEVSIRKVLGATMVQIISLLSGDFLRLVVLSSAIALPVGYYVVMQWLGGFPYHVDLEWWIFLLAGAGAIAIALATILLHVFKAAASNPAEALSVE